MTVIVSADASRQELMISSSSITASLDLTAPAVVRMIEAGIVSGLRLTSLYDVDVLTPHLVQQLHVGLVIGELLQQDLARSHPDLPRYELGQFWPGYC